MESYLIDRLLSLIYVYSNYKISQKYFYVLIRSKLELLEVAEKGLTAEN